MDSLLEMTGLSAGFWGSLGGIIVIMFMGIAVMSGQQEGASNPNPQPARDWDMFKLGEIYDEPCPVEVIHSPPKPKTKSKKSTPEPDPMDDEIKRLKRELQIQTLQNKIEAANQRRESLLSKKDTKKKKPAEKEVSVKHPLFDTCMDTLEALGHKKKDVKDAVEKCLSAYNPATAEEFVTIFYTKVS